MDGANQPAKLHAGHDVLDALVSLVGARPVIQQQQDAGEHLDDEEEERDAAEKIPVGEAMRGDGLMLERGDQPFQIKPFIEPANQRSDHGQASRFRLTTISSPRSWTSKTVSGLGGGPETLRPFRS